MLDILKRFRSRCPDQGPLCDTQQSCSSGLRNFTISEKSENLNLDPSAALRYTRAIAIKFERPGSADPDQSLVAGAIETNPMTADNSADGSVFTRVSYGNGLEVEMLRTNDPGRLQFAIRKGSFCSQISLSAGAMERLVILLDIEVEEKLKVCYQQAYRDFSLEFASLKSGILEKQLASLRNALPPQEFASPGFEQYYLNHRTMKETVRSYAQMDALAFVLRNRA